MISCSLLFVACGEIQQNRGNDVSNTACMTRVTYGSDWIPPDQHPNDFDDFDGMVTWDGNCIDDGSNSYAELSNGLRPYFEGNSRCILALDTSGNCSTEPQTCQTRVTYGPAWLHPADHPAQYDDIDGIVSWGGQCENVGTTSRATLSNGWEPYFEGVDQCAFSFRYLQCDGLYKNPIIAEDCPDPGVTKTNDGYVLACTGGNFRLYSSPDLIQWSPRGEVLKAAPSWAVDRFWAPEIHQLGSDRWVAYYSAGQANGALAIGAAIADKPLGPFSDIGRPLVDDPNPGVIDAHFFQASDGRRFLLWKVDGNAIGQPTPIRIQQVEADGITLIGSAQTILTNDRSWEDHVVEGPWIIERNGFFYLFYSGNAYNLAAYAVGVARSTSPLGPYMKADGPIVTTNSQWAGPGHGSVVLGPNDEWVFVYHAWVGDHVGQSPGRQVLVDRIAWLDDWPQIIQGPSFRSMPKP